MLTSFRPAQAAPAHVQVEITWRCNWRCVHCYQDTHSLRGATTAQLIDLMEELAAAGTLQLIVTGGEPLMRRDLLDILATAYRSGLRITLYTNGHLVTERMADALAEVIGAAELSILSGDDAIHDQLAKVRGSARRAWRGAMLLSERGVAIKIKTPLLRPAVGTFRALADRCAGNGVEWYPDTEISASYDGAEYPLDYQLTGQQLTDFYQEFPRYDPKSGFTTDPGVSDGICLAGRRYCFIDASGNVYPCLSFKAASDQAEARGELSKVKMGNVFEQPFQEIWNAEIGSYIRARTGRDFVRCAGCQGHCRPCMAKNHERTGKLFNNQGSCVGTFLGMPAPLAVLEPS